MPSTNSSNPTRKDITKKLTEACTHYWVKRKYGVHHEVGILPWGRRRVDVVAMNMRGHLVVCEVKSCAADFKTDKKFEEYLPFCNQMFFMVPQNSKRWINHYVDRAKELGIGIMVLDKTTGYTRIVVGAKNRTIDDTVHRNLILRLAWRGADKSRRNTPRRQRIFI